MTILIFMNLAYYETLEDHELQPNCQGNTG